MVEVVEETIAPHYNNVLVSHNVSRFKGGIRQLAACSTLIREVKAILLLLRSKEYLEAFS